MRREVLLLRRSAFSLTPVTREEHYLSRMIGQSGDVFPPVTRREYYLAYMAGDDVPVPVPVTVDEMFLYALCGKSELIPKPVTRLQMFMANSLGEEYELTPITREEMYWNEYVGGAVYDTASGPIATFIAKESPVKQLSVAVEPVQNLNGYDNPWPAGGGKNKLQVTATTQTINGVTFTVNEDGSVSCSGNATETAVFIIANNPSVTAHLINGVSYILSGCPTGGNTGSRYKMDFRQGSNYAIDKGSEATFTFVDGLTDYVVRIVIYVGYGNGLVFKPMIRLASDSDPTFAPYSNLCPISGWDSVNIWVQPTHDTTAEPTATIQLGQTVYGGTLDVVNGKMTVDRYYLHVDAVKSTWGASNGFVRCYRYMTGYDTAFNTPLGSGGIGICNMLTYYSNMYNRNAEGVGLTSGANGYFSIALTTERLNLSGSETSAEMLTAMNAWLLDNPLYILYPLATPFELTLTPEQISTLQGTNNVWSDAGNVTVEYRVR